MFPHLSDLYLGNISRGRANAVTAEYFNNDVESVLQTFARGETPSNYYLNRLLDHSSYINPTSRHRFLNALGGNNAGTTGTVTLVGLDDYYHKDFSKAKVEKEFVNDVDPVSLEHIIDYYYVCQNGHAFSMDGILSYCKNGIRFGRNCKSCSICNAEMKPDLHKQPEILSDIKRIVFNELLTTNAIYDTDRINLALKLFRNLSQISTAGLRKEIEYYRTQTHQ